MEFLNNRRVQIGGAAGLIFSLILLHKLEIGPYGIIPLSSYVPTLTSLLDGFAVGLIVASGFYLVRWLARNYGKPAVFAFPLILVLLGDVIIQGDAITALTSPIAGIVGFIGGVALIIFLMFKAKLITVIPKTILPNVFGSSRWATKDDLEEAGMLGDKDNAVGLFLGKEKESGNAIIYDGDMHALTVAPTRTGKGATAIIPNLLRSNSSILVIDPKGENARRTVERRIELGQKVHVVDPWGVSTGADKFGEGIDKKYISGFNPLGFLDPDDPDLASDAMLLADALVIPAGNDPFWFEEAKSLIQGFILYVLTEPDEKDNQHLGRVRDILSLPMAMEGEDDLEGTLDGVLIKMAGSDCHLVRAAAFRLTQKSDKERAGVISSAQSNTHFLDSPKIRESLAKNDFQFKDLKTGKTGITVYLVLPLDRLPTFHRWLRLLVTSALIDLTRAPIQADKPPVRVILDEFAALQKLSLIETAYGTMAGLGVQLWALTQDLGQLMKLYGDKSWQTFVSNAGVFQYFGSRDYETAKYAEHLCGMTTMKKRSFSFGINRGTSSSSGAQGGSSSTSSGSSETTSIDDISRPLAYADEMMTLHKDLQILFIENLYPITAKKHWWFKEEESDLESET